MLSSLGRFPSSPAALFNLCFLGLALLAAALKFSSRDKSAATDQTTPGAVRALQLRFLPVFWLLRMADWLQGPYFYEVFSSKVFNGQKASLDLVSKLFLTGFGATALFGPTVGRLVDQYGRKLGTLAFAGFYATAALTTKSPLLLVLLFGRILGGIGTSLLFSAPEAWLAAESQRVNVTNYLGGIFGAAYAGDAIVAITAGQLAQQAAGMRGPSGPFEASAVFCAMGAALAAIVWKENKAASSSTEAGPTVKDAAKIMLADKKIMLVGAVQALFEGAMYIFVLQWPPAIVGAVLRVFGADAATPFGTVFSCLMASCLLGSTLFGAIAKKGVRTELSTLGMLAVATAAMASLAGACLGPAAPLATLIAGFFFFEMCVGMYFPSIGTLRAKYLPDSHRSVIMNLFGIPLNVLVVSVFLTIKKLGVGGALSVATSALGLATASAAGLLLLSREPKTSESEIAKSDDPAPKDEVPLEATKEVPLDAGEKKTAVELKDQNETSVELKDQNKSSAEPKDAEGAS